MDAGLQAFLYAPGAPGKDRRRTVLAAGALAPAPAVPAGALAPALAVAAGALSPAAVRRAHWPRSWRLRRAR